MKLGQTLLPCLAILPGLIYGQANITRSLNHAVVLFPGFTALDVFGLLNILNSLAMTYPLNLYILAETLEPVSTHHNMPAGPNSNVSEAVIPTHTFDNAPDDIEVLMVPGGAVTSAPAPALDAHVAFIKKT